MTIVPAPATLPQQVGMILSQTFHVRGTIMETAPAKETLIPGNRFKPTIHPNLRWICIGNGTNRVTVRIVVFSLNGKMLDQVALHEARSAYVMLARSGFETSAISGGEVSEYSAGEKHKSFMYTQYTFTAWFEPSRA